MKKRATSMQMITICGLLCASLGVNAPEVSAQSQTGAQLEKGFVTPPNEAKPRTWWHWMSGNITKDGITKDINWMERTGLGGFHNFDAALQTPTMVKDRIVYMTPEWKEIFKYTTELADSKGFEMTIAGSPGWSESGGPWVKPEQAMKKLAWSEMDLQGGKKVKVAVPEPPHTTGSLQNIEMNARSAFSQSTATILPSYYKDIAVLAIRMPDSYASVESLNPTITSSGGDFALTDLIDGDLVKTTQLAASKPGEKSWIQYEFPSAVTIYAADIVLGGGNGGMRRGGTPSTTTSSIECSNDGKSWTKVADVAGAAAGMTSQSFPAVCAKYFRLVWAQQAPAAPQGGGMFGGFGGGNVAPAATPSQPIAAQQVAEFKLYTTPKVHRFIEKAGFATATDLATAPTPAVNTADVIKASDIIDVTSKVKKGILNWTAPKGNWKIIRIGFSLTGHQNSPASPEATGLEVDKLSKEHVMSYFNQYLDMYKDATGGLMGEKGLQYIITDSWEAGCLNWTDKMFEDFQNMRGYDMHKWLPALVGYVVESPEKSDAFLWDYRKTIGELTVKNHYDALTEILAERGMKGRYTESHENGRAFVADGMEVKKNAAVPMSAMWTTGLGQSGTDIRESSSVSHIYGQKYVAAESLTAGGNPWSYVPETLKPTFDWEIANGLTRLVYHTTVHQPLDDYAPGFTLGPFGQWFGRHETWSGKPAQAWISYITKTSYMMQQGEWVADILYFYGEGINVTGQYNNALPVFPEGYNFDFVNADALINVIEFNGKKLETPAGTQYSLIYLDPLNTKQITVPVLRKLAALAEEGANIVGNKPVCSPSLEDSAEEFNAIVNKLWSNEFGVNKIGKGQVLAGMSMSQALAILGIDQDVNVVGQFDNSEFKYVHRVAGDANIYWILSRTDNTEDVYATFNISGYEPEIWDASTGDISKASYTMEGGKTRVQMHFDPNEALFVVFRNKTSNTSVQLPSKKVVACSPVEGAWTVEFLKGMGAPDKTTFDSLTDWTMNEDPAIKYYSGTARYTKTITVDATAIDGEVWLNLGDIQNIAEVTVNGKEFDVIWKKPYKVNITNAVKPGENKVEVNITNMWVNRLIGDLQPGATKYTGSSQTYQANSPLKPSGLIGPVVIETVK